MNARTFAANAIRAAAVTSLAILAWVALPAAWATTWYVDFEGGANRSDGRAAAQAFKHCPGDPGATDVALATKLAPGDTVIFKGGAHYRGNLAVKWPGQKGKPITYDGNTAGTFGQGRAVLDGADPINGWRLCASAEECGGNPNYRQIYTAFVPTGVKGLAAFTAGLVQGEQMLYPAQYPKPVDPFYADKLDMFLKLPSGLTPTGIADPRLAEIGGPALVGGYACVFVTANDMQFVPIAAYDAAAVAVTFATKTKETAGQYAIANSLSPQVFSRPGEYVFVDKADAQGRHQAFVWPWDDQDLTRAEVGYVARPLGVDMGQGNHYVTLQGFMIQNYQEAIRFRQADGVVIRNNEITRIRQTGFANAVNASGANDFLFADNYAHHLPKMRTVVTHTGERVVYSNNTILRGGRSPLVFYNIKFGRILGNKISDCRGMHSNGISIYVDCRNILVARNEVHNSNIAMTLQNAENIYVVNNLFTGPGVLIGLWGGTPHRNHVFVNNLLFSPERNVYINSREVSGCIFKNNIFGGFDGFRLDASNVLTHNLYTRRLLQPGPGEIVVEDVSKIFADAAQGDFRLRPTGPAVDAGTDVSALWPRDKFPGYDFNVDFAGQPRKFGPQFDLGPFEVAYPAGTMDKRSAAPAAPAGVAGVAGAAGPAGGAVAAPVFKRLAGAEPIVIEAGKFSGQGGGAVEMLDPETVAPGDFVMGWDAAGHWLEYTVEAAAAGEYAVQVRYTTTKDATRQISVDGQPAKGLEAAVFQATGGWRRYREATLPGTVTLKAGRNVLRLTSVNGQGCNLNWIKLRSPGGPEIVIAAGSFTGQGGGKVEIVPGPRHGLFCQWNEVGHWLEWTIDGARAGRYEVRIRYATQNASPRQVSLNGAVVKGLEEVLFEQTDGWRRCEEVSLPAPLELPAGRSVIRMTSLGGGGLNFDELRLIPIE